jgi:vacuolar-type H+-ATPase subunit I/STV1
MKMREQIDTGQEQIDTGQQPLKKFVSTKQKFAAKKLKNQAVNKKKDLAEKRQQNNVVEQFGTTLDNDPVENNSTHGSANRIANKSNPDLTVKNAAQRA